MQEFPENLNFEEEESADYALPKSVGETSVIAHRGKLLIVVGVFALAMFYLGFTAFGSASAYYLTVGEVVTKGPDIYDKNLRVNGKLVPDSFERNEFGSAISFSITDGDQTIEAVYTGLVPDMFFNEHSEILVEGRIGVEQILEAQSIIVKCPSKYEPVEDTDEGSPT